MAKTKTRVYLVVDDAGTESLIEASNRAQAIRHASRGKYSAAPASTTDVIRLMKAGASVAVASEDDSETAAA